MHSFIKKKTYFHCIKNCIGPTYKKPKPRKSAFIKNSSFDINRDPCCTVCAVCIFRSIHSIFNKVVSEWVSQWVSDMRRRAGHAVVFICAYAFVVYADWSGHIRMKPLRKICIVYADIRGKNAYMQKNRICSYEKSSQVCLPIGLMILKTFIVQIVSVHSY